MRRKTLESVQVLRFVAALSVVLFHLPGAFELRRLDRPLFGLGDAGVDLFFVISGFIIAYTTGDGDGSRRFLLRRLIRIVPLYWLLTGAVFLLAGIMPGLTTGAPDAGMLLQSLAFIPYDRGGAGHYPVLFVGWTLNYEMGFYLVFAATMALVPRGRVALASVMIVTGMAVLTPGLLVPGAPPYPLRPFGASIMGEFILGMLLQLLLCRPPGWAGQALVAGACLGAALALGAVSGDHRLATLGLPAAALFALVVVAAGDRRVGRGALLLGEASYALYLVHPFVIRGLGRATEIFAVPPGSAAWWGAAALAVLLSLAAALGLTLRVERPVRAWLGARLLPAAPVSAPAGPARRTAAPPPPPR